jgi:nucleoside-diphosphate-sugar epimerase
MKIAVIGGSGFIGTRLCRRLLSNGHTVTILDKRKSRSFPNLWKHADVCEYESLLPQLHDIDAIVNLAAEHKDNVRPVSLYDEVNVGGAENVCRAAEACRIKKIVFTSSVAVYGFAPANADETEERKPFNDYGRTKMLAEDVYRNWLSGSEDRSLTIIRPTVVFGEDNRGNVYNLLRQISEGKFVMIGSGENKKSMAYVENVAAFLEYSLDSGRGEQLYNYVDKPDFTMNELVRCIKGQLGGNARLKLRIPYWIGLVGGKLFDLISFVCRKELPVSAIRVKKFCMTTQFSAERVQQSGFKQPVDIAEGLKRTVYHEFLNKDKKQDRVLYYSE